jgi:hypothetical protein
MISATVERRDKLVGNVHRIAAARLGPAAQAGGGVLALVVDEDGSEDGVLVRAEASGGVA